MFGKPGDGRPQEGLGPSRPDLVQVAAVEAAHLHRRDEAVAGEAGAVDDHVGLALDAVGPDDAARGDPLDARR